MNLLINLILFLNLFFFTHCDNTCMLTQSSPVNVNKYQIYMLLLQPFPNLKKCYKHNEAACCNIINDGVISEYIESYIPEDCLRLFPELEDLLCFGCHEKESQYRSDGQLRVCKSFASKIWKAELDQPSTRFDGCGLLAEENNFKDEDTSDFGYIIPSKVFSTFEAFINKLGIPYYDGYTITVVDDGDNCFNNQDFIKENIFAIFLLISFILL